MIGLNKIVFFSSKFTIIVSIFLTLVPHLEHLVSSRYFAVSRYAFCFSFKKKIKNTPQKHLFRLLKKIYITKCKNPRTNIPFLTPFRGSIRDKSL